MTWNPRKKAYLTQRPSAVPPLLSTAEDRELDVAVQRLIHVESTIRKLTKETKRYLEAIGSLDRADQRLSSNLSSSDLAHVNDEFRRIVESYHSVTTSVGRTLQETSVLTQKTFIEPLKKLRDEFALVAEALAKREELATVWRNCHARLKKIQDKRDRTASHAVKLERERRAEEAAGKELRALHARLLVELPWFLEKRLEYIKPSVHALILVQLDYYGTATTLFTQLLPQGLDVASDSDVLSEHFHRIKELAIIKQH